MLTIAIPTFNRNQELIETLYSVIPQLNEYVNLLIIDNKSTIPVRDSLLQLNISPEKYKLIENKVNIGGNANILRCFENCETEWLWVLGDDDIPSSDAVDLILKRIHENNKSVYMNFASCVHDHNRNVLRNTSGQIEFVNNITHWGQINFTSVCVFNCQKLIPYLRFGYQYAYTWSPHIALVLTYMAYHEGDASFYSDKIIDDVCTTNSENKWHPIGPLLGKMALIELPIKYKTKLILANKINSHPTLEFLLYDCLKNIVEDKNKKESLFIYKLATSKLYILNPKITTKIKILFYRVLLIFPRISFKAINYIIKSKGFNLIYSNNKYTRL